MLLASLRLDAQLPLCGVESLGEWSITHYYRLWAQRFPHIALTFDRCFEDLTGLLQTRFTERLDAWPMFRQLDR